MASYVFSELHCSACGDCQGKAAILQHMHVCKGKILMFSCNTVWQMWCWIGLHLGLWTWRIVYQKHTKPNLEDKECSSHDTNNICKPFSIQFTRALLCRWHALCMLHMYCTCQVSQKKFTWSQQEHKSSSVHMPCLVQAADMLHLPGLPKNKQTSKVVETTWKALRQLSCSEACSRTIMADQKTAHFLICSLIGIAYYLLVTE